MAQGNVELVRSFYAGLPEDLVDLYRDESRMNALMAATTAGVTDDFQVVLHEAPSLGIEPSASGVQGFREAWRAWLGAWESFRAEVEDVVEVEDRVVVLIRLRRRAPGGETEERPVGAVWTFRAGRVARIDFGLDREEALRLAGRQPLGGGGGSGP